MDKKKEFQIFLRVLGLFVLALLVIACTAGCASFAIASGKAFYWLPAVANIAGWAVVYVKVIKKLKDEGKLSQSMEEGK